MSKLIIGPFKDMSGYAKLGREYVKALLSVVDNDDYSLASVRYDSGRNAPMETVLADAHDRQIDEEIDTVIQIVTPNEMRPVPGKRNIAICCWETDKIPVYWVVTLNAFDEIIVPCEANKQAFINSGVSKPIHIVHMPLFKDEYNLDDVEPFIIPEVSESTTIYYNISQWSHKKGIDALIRAYFLAFQNGEDVLLVLKGYVGMKNQQGDSQRLISAIDDIKESMRLKSYPKVYITDVTMNDAQLKQIHKLGDCYVNMSRGEGWGIPPFEALAYGNELVTTMHTGMKEWADEKMVWTVSSMLDSVHNMPHSDPNLYTANECWYEPNALNGSIALKLAAADGEKQTEATMAEFFEKFSPTKIGNQLKEIIE